MKKRTNIQLASINQCTGCAACVSICPTKSITMVEDKEGFLQPHIDPDTCIKCHKCEKTCPIVTPMVIPTDFETQVFAAINNDEAIRMRSSSGGIFHALAKWTVEQGGVVFGARFDEKWEVVHDYTEKVCGIEPFLRSKYVQSRIGNSYGQVKAFLKAGRQVLFVGTPCQIGGLHAYLGEDYENLIMVDFICHGIPSPGMWREYLREKVEGGQILDVNFRDKRDGWRKFQYDTIIATTADIREKQEKNLFMKGFLCNVYLRKSCYQCQFKGIDRESDITLADFWGIEKVCPEIDDNNGISALFVHSNKGHDVIEQLQSKLQIYPQRVQDVIACNHSMVESVPLTSRRSRFYFFHKFLPVTKLFFAIEHDWLLVRVVRKIRRLFK